MLTRKTKKDRKVSLNLNIYRNLNFIVNNQSKIAFKHYVYPQVMGLEIKPPVEIIYTLFPKTKRNLDISNILCIVDKFFCDCLVDIGCLEDDNYNYLPRVVYQFGEVDKNNPRAEALIKSI